MKPLLYPLLGLAFLMPLAASSNSLPGYPADETCEAERNESYSRGYFAGDTDGYNRGYPIGFGDGAAHQIAKCVADPQGCGITLASCIPDATYGETEPNDNFIAADPLTLGVNFWGQLYGTADQDWFYTATTSPNQNLLINFSIPDWIQNGDLSTGTPAVWNLSVRDAAGNIFANFNTNVAGGIQTTPTAVTYSVTLGLVGTYYIVIKPVNNDLSCTESCDKTAYSYAVAAFLQDSSLVNNQPIVGFYDAEIEPNNVPSRANPLATGVSMYGMISLTFNSTYPGAEDDDPYRWGQGEDDWFVYKSDGNEIITLSFCSKEECGVGDWFVEVYDQPSATALENGTPRENLQPLMAFNTNLYQCGDSEDDLKFCIDEDHPKDPEAYRIGLKDPGYYFMRVNHMRLFTAPCVAYSYVSSTENGGFVGSCACSDGGNQCSIPSDLCEKGDILCQNRVSTEACIPGIEPGCQEECTTEGEGEEQKEVCTYWYTDAVCTCSQYGGVVVLPSVYTSPYNFTWHGTKLPTNTIDTDAYEDYLNRPSPY